MAVRGYSNYIKNELDQEIAPEIQNQGGQIQALQGDVSQAQADISSNIGRLDSAETGLSTAQSDIGTLQGDVSATQNDVSSLQTAFQYESESATLERVALQDKDVEHDQTLESRLLDLQTMLDVIVVEVAPPGGLQKLSDGSGNYLKYDSSSAQYEFTADSSGAVSVEFIQVDPSGAVWHLKDGSDNYIASDGTQKSVLDENDSDTYRIAYAPAKVGEDRLAIRHLTNAVDYMGPGSGGVFELGGDKFVVYEAV